VVAGPVVAGPVVADTGLAGTALAPGSFPSRRMSTGPCESLRLPGRVGGSRRRSAPVFMRCDRIGWAGVRARDREAVYIVGRIGRRTQCPRA
jgi:hypothetical protein